MQGIMFFEWFKNNNTQSLFLVEIEAKSQVDFQGFANSQ